jgi:hypothetical protein
MKTVMGKLKVMSSSAYNLKPFQIEKTIRINILFFDKKLFPRRIATILKSSDTAIDKYLFINTKDWEKFKEKNSDLYLEIFKNYKDL